MKSLVVDVQHHQHIMPYPAKKPEEEISFMDSHGINFAVITNQLPEASDSNIPLHQMTNDKLIETGKAWQNRLIPCPSIPTHSSRAAIDELERTCSLIDLKCAHIRPIRGRIDREELDPFYSKVCDMKIPLLVHPVYSAPPYDALFSGASPLGAGIGFVFDTTTAISWLMYSGLLDRFPKLKLVFFHLGGAVPFLLGRLEAVYEDGFKNAKKRPSDYLRMLYFDTVCYDREALEYTLKIVGSDRLLFGSDFGCPGKGLVQPELFLRNISSLNISESEKAKIIGGNAIELFRLAEEQKVSVSNA